MAGRLSITVKPRAARDCFTMLMNGPRLMTTCPLLTVTVPFPSPEPRYKWLNPADSSFDMGTVTGCLAK